MNAMGGVIAQKLHETVSTGELGDDYILAGGRDKYLKLIRKYNVDNERIREILLDIDVAHYIKSERSANEKHQDDTVHIFKIVEKLMPKFDEKADYVSVCLYIKVTWPESKSPMFIISFHEDEE